MKYFFRKHNIFSDKDWQEVSYKDLQKIIDEEYDDCCVVILVKAEKDAFYFEYNEFEC